MNAHIQGSTVYMLISVGEKLVSLIIRVLVKVGECKSAFLEGGIVSVIKSTQYLVFRLNTIINPGEEGTLVTEG